MSTGYQPRLSVIVVFFNMRREARRTLHTLSVPYQRGVDAADYEVIAIDNGSSEPLDPVMVRSFGSNFRYMFWHTESRSPVEAVRQGVGMARGEVISIAIDGARMLSPGVIRYTLTALSAFSHPVVCTLGWHLGHDLQNISMQSGYNQEQEDRLLTTIGWEDDGYELFAISTLAGSSEGGWVSEIHESNFISVHKTTYRAVGGYPRDFQSPGGGLANLSFLANLVALPETSIIYLLGEGCFHQFHGGVATNVPKEKHPWADFRREYERITGSPYRRVEFKPEYIGHLPTQARRFLDPKR